MIKPADKRVFGAALVALFAFRAIAKHGPSLPVVGPYIAKVL